MKVTVDERDIKSIVGALFQASHNIWGSVWFRKDGQETAFAKRVVASETVVWKALEEYFKNNK